MGGFLKLSASVKVSDVSDTDDVVLLKNGVAGKVNAVIPYKDLRSKLTEGLAEEAGKNVADAVKVTGDVLPTLGDANKRYSFTTGSEGRTLTHGATSLVYGANKQCSAFWDGTAKTWAKEDEVELPKVEISKSLDETVEGKALDATKGKELNDKVEAIKGEILVNDIVIKPLRVNSQTGELVTSGYYGHYSIVIPVGATSLNAQFANYNQDSSKIGGAFYDVNGVYISGVNYFTGIAGQRHNIPIPSNAKRFDNTIWNGDLQAPVNYRFNFESIVFYIKNSLTEISTNLTAAKNDITETNIKVSKVENDTFLLKGEVVKNEIQPQTGRVNGLDGTIGSSGYYRHYSERIPKGTKKLDAQFANYGGVVGYAFYNSNGDFITGGVFPSTDEAGQRHEVNVPVYAEIFKNSVPILEGTSTAPVDKQWVFDKIRFLTGDGIAEIKSEISEVTKKVTEIEQSSVVNILFNSTHTESGYWTLSGDVVGVKSNNSLFRLLRIPILRNDIVNLHGYIGGTTNARAWAITDNNLTILSRSDGNANLITNPVSMKINTDGFLYVNSTIESVGTLSVELLKNLKSYVDDKLQETTISLKEQIERKAGVLGIFRNNPLPINNETYKVLAFGNSFTNDKTAACGKFISSSGIDINKVALYTATIGGSSLQTWRSAYDNDTLITEYARKAGGISMNPASLTMKDILSQDWDVIIIQQLSNYSADFESIERDLPFFIKKFKQHCTNQKVAVAWHSVWSYTQDHNPGFWGIEGLKKICETTQQVALRLGVDIIIPTGTAIQNARGVLSPKVNGGNDLTRDGYHLQYGTGRYIAAATLFYSIFSPVFNVPLLGNSARYPLTQEELLNQYSVAVDETNYLVCQKAAFNAVNDMWNINNPS